MTFGKKHPWALGQPAREVWSEAWKDLEPRVDEVVRRGQATYVDKIRPGSVEPWAVTKAKWIAKIRRKERINVLFQRECTPGFYPTEAGVAWAARAGNPSHSRKSAFALSRRWRKEGMTGLDLRMRNRHPEDLGKEI
jgi:hypothetical protein